MTFCDLTWAPDALRAQFRNSGLDFPISRLETEAGPAARARAIMESMVPEEPSQKRVLLEATRIQIWELSSGSSKASLRAGTGKKQDPSQPASTPHHEPTKRCRAKTTPVPKQDQTPSTMTPAAKQAKPNELATPPPTGKKLVFDDAGTSSEL